jgi:Acetyl xylan esterase (AXE1)
MRTATARRPSRAWSGSGRAVTCSASNVRGFGRSVDAVPYPSPAGWLLTGVRSPETSVLRGAVCDYVRATEVADALGVSTLRAVRHGVSLAGGLALMAEAVAPRADLLALGVPTRCGEEVLVEDAYPSAHPRRRTARDEGRRGGLRGPRVDQGAAPTARPEPDFLLPCWSCAGHQELCSGITRPPAGTSRSCPRSRDGSPGSPTRWRGTPRRLLLSGRIRSPETLDPCNWTGDKGYVGRGVITPIRKNSHRDLLDWEKG